MLLNFKLIYSFIRSIYYKNTILQIHVLLAYFYPRKPGYDTVWKQNFININSTLPSERNLEWQKIGGNIPKEQKLLLTTVFHVLCD